MKKVWPKLLLIILLAVILRLPTFLGGFVNIDENEYSIAAQKILAGGVAYKDFLIYQPPIIYYLYALGFWITGGTHIWSAHIITILFVVGTIIALYHLAYALTKSTKAGLASALAYGLFSTTFLPQDMLAANCEILMMFPITLSVLTLYYAEKRSNSLLYVLTGIFASVGVLTKYQGGVVIAAEGFYLLVISAILRRSFSIKKNLIPSILLTFGFFIPLLLTVLYFWVVGALTQAVDAWMYILLYAKGPVQSDPLYVLIKFVMRTSLFILSGIVMWIGASSVIKSRLKNAFRNRLDNSNEQFLIFSIIWFFISIIPILVGGRVYPHYYFVILPPAALLFGIWWHENGTRLRSWVKFIILLWLIICTIGWTIYASYKPYRKLGPKDMWVHAANYVRNNAKPEDTLFVWGYCPQIYIHSGLINKTRFTTTDYLTGRSPMTAGLEYDPNGSNVPSSFRKAINDFIDPPGVVIFDTSENIFPKAWQYLKEDFERELPTYILDTAPSNYRRYGRYPIEKYPFLSETISKNYELVKSIKGYDIYRVKD